MISTAKRGEGGVGAVKEQSFCMLLKLSWYKFKLECYIFRMLKVIAMVATRKSYRIHIKGNETGI